MALGLLLASHRLHNLVHTRPKKNTRTVRCIFAFGKTCKLFERGDVLKKYSTDDKIKPEVPPDGSAFKDWILYVSGNGFCLSCELFNAFLDLISRKSVYLFFF